MRTAFLGTPEFALPSLQRLFDAGHELFVFTQPDRPRDRGHSLVMPPVKKLALELGLPVYQFARIRDPEGVEALRGVCPEIMVTAAFGQILSAENLAVPMLGCINVHGSLLPAYRGAAPIQWAVINGERITGVTTMMTDIGLDTGDVLLKRETQIGPDETAGELYSRLAEMGADLLIETIDALTEGRLIRTPQDEALATRCGMIKKEMARIDFNRTAHEVHCLVRGMNPAPGAFTVLAGQTVKVWKTAETAGDTPFMPEAPNGACVIADPKRGLFIKCADALIEVKELQFPGSKRMEAKAALNGKRLLGMVAGQ